MQRRIDEDDQRGKRERSRRPRPVVNRFVERVAGGREAQQRQQGQPEDESEHPDGVDRTVVPASTLDLLGRENVVGQAGIPFAINPGKPPFGGWQRQSLRRTVRVVTPCGQKGGN